MTKKNCKKWVIICKLFEIIKGSIIILSTDCNTHLHTISKKQKILNVIISGENNGGTGHQVGEKCSFWGRQKFLVDGVAEGSKIWLGAKHYLVWPGS